MTVESVIEVDEGVKRESLPCTTVPTAVPYSTPNVVRADCASAAVISARPVAVELVMDVEDTD